MKESSILPTHIGIIIDGNGRWAEKKGENRSNGHKAGANNLIRIIKFACDLRIKYISIYAFSKENWQRPKDEVDSLLSLINNRIDLDDFLDKNNIRFLIAGSLSELPSHIKCHLEHCVEKSSNNTGLTLCIAINYSSKSEIVNAAKILAEKVVVQSLNTDDFDEELFSRHLYTYPMPDIDFLIRTGGECRLSNFMLWQLSYAELYFTSKLWPDFNEKDFCKSLLEYQKRDRRFGKVN